MADSEMKECPQCHYHNISDDDVYVCVSCGRETCTDCGGTCGCEIEEEDRVMEKPTIEEVQKIYLEVFGESCDEVKADELAVRFIDNYEYAIKMPKFSIKTIPEDPSSLLQYIEYLKSSETREKLMEDYRIKVANMTPEERFMHQEGFDSDLGKDIYKFIHDDVEGKKLYQDILQIMMNCDRDIYLLKTVTTLSKGFPEYFGGDESIKKFIETDRAKSLLSWFDGIMCDGLRAMRTIIKCAIAFNQYYYMEK
jgi:hypothetical protein